ncbi:MAG: hypothetical protein QOF53_3230, partial [Nocardioidaceae bacterium]|nr:hypothetical protein [Nocardioidaceae bacterium]
MTSATQYDSTKDTRATLIQEVLASLGPDALTDPNLGDIVNRLVDQKMAAGGATVTAPQADGGLA